MNSLRAMLLLGVCTMVFILPARAEPKRIAVLELRGKVDSGVRGLLTDEVRAGALAATDRQQYLVMESGEYGGAPPRSGNRLHGGRQG